MGSSYEIDRARGEIAAAHQALTAAGVPKGHDAEPLTLPGRIIALTKMTGDLIAEVGRLRAGVAAGPQATPDPKIEVARVAYLAGDWTGLEVALGIPQAEGGPTVVVPHGHHDRVVAVPTDHEDPT